MNILYEDDSLLVCDKEAGLAVESADLRRKDLVSLLKNEYHTSYLGVVHRLDQPVRGLMVFARTPKAAAELSAQSASGKMRKEYLAVVLPGDGVFLPEEMTLTDHLLRDGRSNTSRVVPAGTKGARRASLSFTDVTGAYEISKLVPAISCEKKLHLLRVRLHTGRHHQIRVQLSHAGYPVLGDRKYGRDEQGSSLKFPALCAAALTFVHPESGAQMAFELAEENLCFV